MRDKMPAKRYIFKKHYKDFMFKWYILMSVTFLNVKTVTPHITTQYAITQH